LKPAKWVSLLLSLLSSKPRLYGPVSAVGALPGRRPKAAARRTQEYRHAQCSGLPIRLAGRDLMLVEAQ